MHRRCIICGHKPDEQSVYPRNMEEARQWQNQDNLRSYDVETKSLCQHGCVCALHLDTDQECGSDSDAVRFLRNTGGKIPAKRKNTSIKWSSSGSCRCESAVPQDYNPYPSNTSTNGRMQRQSKQNLEPMPKESVNGDRSNIELHRCRGAILQENLYTRMRKNGYPQQPIGSSSGTAPPRNLKTSKQTVPKLYACIKYPILQNSNAVPKKSTCHLMWSPSSERASCDYSNTSQRTQNNTQDQCQHGPQTYHQHPSFTYNQQQFQSDDDCCQSCSPITDSHQERMPEVKNKCVQAYCSCQLKDQWVQCSQDQEVQCIQVNLQSEAFSAAVSQPSKGIQIAAGCDCEKTNSRSSQRSTSLATKYDSVSASKAFSTSGNINMPNFECSCEEQKYSANAVNVLLMNGPRHNNYEGPNPEICVQESDLADCNERAVFPHVDKPCYRICRAATSPPNAKGKQDEANVLVLEHDSIPEGQSNQGGQSQSEIQFVEGTNSINQGITSAQFCDNSINSPFPANFNKVLELQRSRINELENLLQQHNKLQQTIQAKMSDLQSQEMPEPEMPAKRANKK